MLHTELRFWHENRLGFGRFDKVSTYEFGSEHLARLLLLNYNQQIISYNSIVKF